MAGVATTAPQSASQWGIRLSDTNPGSLHVALFQTDTGPERSASRGAIAASACLAVLGTYTALAQWLGVARSQPGRWLSGREQMSKHSERLVTDLAYIIDRSRQVWHSEEAVRNWLTGSDPLLDGASPLDAVRLGDVAAVVKAVDGQLAGSYA